MDRALWERSGHWENYRENMFTTSSENRDYAVKPMNCPEHIQIFNQGIRSYRDLPLRLAEFGSCHRNEPSGALHGIMRVRGFVQDDAHIFCTEDQVQSEAAAFIDLLRKVYRDFGFEEILIKLATRPPKRIGSDDTWERAEAALSKALDSKGLVWQLSPGDGAFYGPKIEFSLKDSIGRVWQCGTLQLDFMLPARLGAEYVADDNTRKVPVMLHRAILGSMERFIGILIEHYAGAMPLWLSPLQVVVLNISEHQSAYAGEVAAILGAAGVRAEADLRNEKITFKIREHSLQKLPYQAIVGEKEVASRTVAVRTRGRVDLGQIPIDAFVARLKAELSPVATA
jgi:threonyl-tRNA synthetase